MVEDGHGRLALTALPPAPAAALAALYAREPQCGDDGVLHPVDGTTRIKPEEGLELIALLEQAGADDVLEIGLAYGFSSQFLLAGLQQRGGGRLLAIDPLQSTDWHGIGRRLAAAAATTPTPSWPPCSTCHLTPQMRRLMTRRRRDLQWRRQCPPGRPT